ncbi:DUF4861 domain-containing protein [Cytophagales bacterium WSM2-2]|nr:DUF4861 domain-containing protein [Cytophagales bacterium WSM2-2]
MKILHSLLIIVVFHSYVQAQDWRKQYPVSFQVKVSNPVPVVRQEAFVFISAAQLPKDFNSKAFVVLDKGQEIASQYNANDTDYKGVVLVLPELKANESHELEVRYAKTGEIKREYTKRTQAELSYKTGGEWKNREYIGGTFKNTDFLRVPAAHKDHSWFLRYEGPGWESDKVGYRMYLDQRNATDVYGKLTSKMVLQDVGMDGFESYHHMQSWGMDVMKVGKSLGIGSIGAMVDGKVTRVEKTDSVNSRITENGNVFSSILTNYYGWKIGDKKHDLKSRMTIHAGTRLTHQFLTLTNNPETICTGIVTDKKAVLLSSKGNAANFGYLATYGKQSLNGEGDELGLAVFFRSSDATEFTDDEFSHIVKLKTTSGKVEYYFVGAWVLEPDGIKDQKQFEAYLKQTAMELANPVRVEIKK